MRERCWALLLAILACTNERYLERAETLSASLVENLCSDSAISYFSETYFSKDQIRSVLNGVRERCDYSHRKGGYRGYSVESFENVDRASFIYEFAMKCDSVRFVFTYELREQPLLVSFIVEPMEIGLSPK
jgi:hypothetical protein